MFPVWTLWHGGAQPLWLSIYFVVTYTLIYFSLQCLGIGLLMFPVWTLWHGGAQPLWLSIYFVVTYTLIYFSLILCLYSGWQYVHGVMDAKKRAAR